MMGATFKRLLGYPPDVIAIFSDGFGREFRIDRENLADRIRNLQGYGLSTDEEQKAQIAMTVSASDKENYHP